jgi:hypothetical protein
MHQLLFIVGMILVHIKYNLFINRFICSFETSWEFIIKPIEFHSPGYPYFQSKISLRKSDLQAVCGWSTAIDALESTGVENMKR